MEIPRKSNLSGKNASPAKKFGIGVPRTHFSSVFEVFTRTEIYKNGMETAWSGVRTAWSGMEDVVGAKFSRTGAKYSRTGEKVYPYKANLATTKRTL